MNATEKGAMDENMGHPEFQDNLTFAQFLRYLVTHLTSLQTYIERYIKRRVLIITFDREIMYTRLVYDFENAVHEFLEKAANDTSPLTSEVEGKLILVLEMIDSLWREFDSVEDAKKAYAELIDELNNLETYDLSVITLPLKDPILFD